MAKKTRSRLRKAHSTEKGRRRQIDLAKHGKGGEALANASLAKPVEETGLLRRVFRLAKGSFTAQERVELVSDIEKRIAQSTINLRNYNVKNARQFAELLVKEIEDMDVSPKTFRAFVSNMRIEGYRGRLRGKLFHFFVENFEPLQQDFKKTARRQVQELNNLPKPFKLLNAKGNEIPGPVKFSTPLKAKNIRILKKDGRSVEFIDNVFTAYSEKGEATLWSFLIEIEVKTPAAAKGFGKQIGSAQLRMMMDEVDEIVMEVEGFPDFKRIKPENLIFSPRSIDRNAVTLLGESSWARLTKDEQIRLTEALRKGDKEAVYDASGFRFQLTAKGQGETFRRVTLAVRTDELEKIIRAILP